MKRASGHLREAGRKRTGPLHRGFLAPCSRCGAMVVHARSTGEPFHMHRRSKTCRDNAKALNALEKKNAEELRRV